MEKVLNRFINEGFGYRMSRRNYTLLVVIMTLAGLVLAIGSIALWLFAFNYVLDNPQFSQLTTWLVIFGLVAVGASLLVGLGMSVETYTFPRACKVSYCASFVLLTVLFWIVTFCLASSAGNLTFSLGLLLVILGIPAGAALGLLPSLLGSIAGWITRQIVLIVNNR